MANVCLQVWNNKEFSLEALPYAILDFGPDRKPWWHHNDFKCIKNISGTLLHQNPESVLSVANQQHREYFVCFGIITQMVYKLWICIYVHCTHNEPIICHLYSQLPKPATGAIFSSLLSSTRRSHNGYVGWCFCWFICAAAVLYLQEINQGHSFIKGKSGYRESVPYLCSCREVKILSKLSCFASGSRSTSLDLILVHMSITLSSLCCFLWLAN